MVVMSTPGIPKANPEMAPHELIEHCLYGIKVLTEFPLFDHPCPTSAVAPGEHPPVLLRPVSARSAVPETPQTTSLYQAHDRQLSLHTDRELALSAPGQPWRLEVKGVVSFSWQGDQPAVYYQFHEQGNRQLLVFWLVHIFLPLYLTLERGYDFIHAAAVEVNEQPILFIAESTGGKSTLGDYFLRKGHAMLADDKVATFLYQGEFHAVPSHPHHRPWRQFEVLGDPVDTFATRARPIHAFYVLEAGEPDSDTQITEITGYRKFEYLLPNYLYSFRFLQALRLRWLGQLSHQSLVFRVRRPWDLARLPEVYAAICSHSRGLNCAFSPPPN